MTDTAISPMLDISSYRSLGSARNRRVTVIPETTSNVTGSTSTQETYFSIPSSKYSMINGQGSYLYFDYAITGSSTLASETLSPINLGPKNGSAQSFIKTVETMVQSQSCEYLDNYNVFSAIMDDFQAKGRSANVGSILQGSINPDCTTARTTANSATFLNTFQAIKQPFPHTNAQVYRACIPIYSAVLGVLAETYVPAGDGIRLRIVWDTILKSCFGATATAYTLSNIRLQMDYIDIEPAVWMNLVAEGKGVLKSHATAIANYETSVDLADRTQSILIPARFSSVKFLMSCWRNSATPTSLLNSVGSRLFPNLDQFCVNIGGKNYPSTNISAKLSDGTYTGAETFMEVCRIFSQIHSPQFDIVFDVNEYLGTTTLPSMNSFVLGLCFEEYSGANKLVSGIDTNSTNLYLQTTHSADLATACVVDSFVGYDLIIELDSATNSMSFSK